MNPKLALSLFAALVVALAVASAMAQAPARDPRVVPDLPNTPHTDRVRFTDPLSPTRKSADLEPADPEPSRHPVHSPFKPSTTTDPFFRQIGGEEAELISQTNTLIRQIETADSGSQRESAKAKLGELLGKQFDLRQKRHDREIKALEAQVKKLKDLVQKRQENREEIIARRLDQIVRESQGLGF